MASQDRELTPPKSASVSKMQQASLLDSPIRVTRSTLRRMSAIGSSTSENPASEAQPTIRRSSRSRHSLAGCASEDSDAASIHSEPGGGGITTRRTTRASSQQPRTPPKVEVKRTRRNSTNTAASSATPRASLRTTRARTKLSPVPSEETSPVNSPRKCIEVPPQKQDSFGSPRRLFSGEKSPVKANLQTSPKLIPVLEDVVPFAEPKRLSLRASKSPRSVKSPRLVLKNIEMKLDSFAKDREKQTEIAESDKAATPKASGTLDVTEKLDDSPETPGSAKDASPKTPEPGALKSSRQSISQERGPLSPVSPLSSRSGTPRGQPESDKADSLQGERNSGSGEKASEDQPNKNISTPQKEQRRSGPSLGDSDPTSSQTLQSEPTSMPQKELSQTLSGPDKETPSDSSKKTPQMSSETSFASTSKDATPELLSLKEGKRTPSPQREPSTLHAEPQTPTPQATNKTPRSGSSETKGQQDGSTTPSESAKKVCTDGITPRGRNVTPLRKVTTPQRDVKEKVATPESRNVTPLGAARQKTPDSSRTRSSASESGNSPRLNLRRSQIGSDVSSGGVFKAPVGTPAAGSTVSTEGVKESPVVGGSPRVSTRLSLRKSISQVDTDEKLVEDSHAKKESPEKSAPGENLLSEEAEKSPESEESVDMEKSLALAEEDEERKVDSEDSSGEIEISEKSEENEGSSEYDEHGAADAAEEVEDSENGSGGNLEAVSEKLVKSSSDSEEELENDESSGASNEEHDGNEVIVLKKIAVTEETDEESDGGGVIAEVQEIEDDEEDGAGLETEDEGNTSAVFEFRISDEDDDDREGEDGGEQVVEFDVQEVEDEDGIEDDGIIPVVEDPENEGDIDQKCEDDVDEEEEDSLVEEGNAGDLKEIDQKCEDDVDQEEEEGNADDLKEVDVDHDEGEDIDQEGDDHEKEDDEVDSLEDGVNDIDHLKEDEGVDQEEGEDKDDSLRKDKNDVSKKCGDEIDIDMEGFLSPKHFKIFESSKKKEVDEAKRRQSHTGVFKVSPAVCVNTSNVAQDTTKKYTPQKDSTSSDTLSEAISAEDIQKEINTPGQELPAPSILPSPKETVSAVGVAPFESPVQVGESSKKVFLANSKKKSNKKRSGRIEPDDAYDFSVLGDAEEATMVPNPSGSFVVQDKPSKTARSTLKGAFVTRKLSPTRAAAKQDRSTVKSASGVWDVLKLKIKKKQPVEDRPRLEDKAKPVEQSEKKKKKQRPEDRHRSEDEAVPVEQSERKKKKKLRLEDRPRLEDEPAPVEQSKKKNKQRLEDRPRFEDKAAPVEQSEKKKKKQRPEDRHWLEDESGKMKRQPFDGPRSKDEVALVEQSVKHEKKRPVDKARFDSEVATVEENKKDSPSEPLSVDDLRHKLTSSKRNKKLVSNVPYESNVEFARSKSEDYLLDEASSLTVKKKKLIPVVKSLSSDRKRKAATEFTELINVGSTKKLKGEKKADRVVGGDLVISDETALDKKKKKKKNLEERLLELGRPRKDFVTVGNSTESDDEAPTAVSFSDSRQIALEEESKKQAFLAQKEKLAREKKKLKLQRIAEQKAEKLKRKADQLEDYIPLSEIPVLPKGKKTYFGETEGERRSHDKAGPSRKKQTPSSDQKRQEELMEREKKRREKGLAELLKRRKVKSSSFIPVDAPSGATRFGVVPLKNLNNDGNRIGEAAAFRSQMLYGNRVNRVSNQVWQSQNEKKRAGDRQHARGE